MLTRTSTRLRTLTLTLWMTALLSGVPPTLLAQAPAKPAPTPTPAAAPVEERDARETRERLREIFNQYPPSVGQVLRLDPSLLTKPEYMVPYPTLAAFIAQHPEVAHNPAFFIGESRFDGSDTPRRQAINAVENIFTAAMLLTGFLGFFTLVGWLVQRGSLRSG